MNDNVYDHRMSPRLTYGTIIQCSQCISGGKIHLYDSPLEIQVLNISNEGLCISSTEVFEEGAILEFNIQLEDILYRSISATIIWSIKNANVYNYGLHIMNITGKFGVHIYKIGSRLSTRI
jgi:PilZ domain.